MAIIFSKYTLIFFSLLTLGVFLKMFFEFYIDNVSNILKILIRKFLNKINYIYINSDVYKNHINKKIEKNLPTFLDALSSSINSGLNLINSFEFLSRELDFPLNKFAKEIANKMSLNMKMEDSFKSIEEKFQSDEILLFISSLKLQLKYGGNLTNVLQNISSSIRDREKIRRDIRSFTSQGKMSALIMVFLGPFALFVFAKITPEYIAPMFHTNIGQLLLAIAIILEVIGFFWMYKIINIKF